MGYVFLALVVGAVLFLAMLFLDINPVPSIVASDQSDEKSLAAITGSGSESDGIHTLYQKMKLNNQDVALMRRDVRRAIAAYPDIDEDHLLTGRWFAFDEAARVPSKGFYNSHGTQDPITKEYYLESAHMSIVKLEFPNRADDATTERFFAERKVKRHAEKIDRLKKDGPFTMWSGTGGSMNVGLDKETGKVVVTRAQKWAASASRWTFPFVAEEWADINASDLEAIKKLPSFAVATEDQVPVRPSGVTMGPTTSFGRTFDGVLMPGESIGVSTSINNR